jgi:nicotinamide riboside transporter PnuC
MKVLGWIATTLTVSGVILNASQIIWCWPIWIIANIFWIYSSFKKKDWPQFVLFAVFTITNFYGWYVWSILK